MLNRHELMAKEHQRDLLREVERRRLIRELRTARRKEPSRLRDRSQKKAHGVLAIKPRSI